MQSAWFFFFVEGLAISGFMELYAMEMHSELVPSPSVLTPDGWPYVESEKSQLCASVSLCTQDPPVTENENTCHPSAHDFK